MSPAKRQIGFYRRGSRTDHDAAIRGDLAAFLAVLQAGRSGDALQVSGDRAAVLALRHALDDAGLDLTEELAAIPGEPYCGWMRRISPRPVVQA